MAKKKQEIKLEGLDGINFNAEPDVEAAQSVVQPKKETVKPEEPPKPKPVPRKRKKEAVVPEKVAKGTFPPPNKKRASFNIDEDLHKALKDYSYFEEIEMVEYVFEHLVKPDLTKKGFYPPKKKKR